MKLLRRVCIDVSVHAVIEEEVLMWVVIKHVIYIFSMWLVVSLSVCVCVSGLFISSFWPRRLNIVYSGGGALRDTNVWAHVVLGENGCDACFFISDRCCRGAQLSLVSFAICQIASSERPRLEYLSSDWDWIYFFYTVLLQIEMNRRDELRKTFLSN